MVNAQMVLSAAAVAVAVACSPFVSFPEDGRPCGPPERECLDGYSCLGRICVEHGTVEENGTCTANEHCIAPLACVGFACRDLCERPYLEDACPAERYCMRNHDGDGAPVAACVPSECGAAAACPPRGTTPFTCATLAPGFNACVESCQVVFSGGVATDECADSPLAQNCQPSGKPGLMVCTARGNLEHGSPCDQVDELCADGIACVAPSTGAPYCLAYCDPAQGAAACTARIDPWKGGQAVCTGYGTFSACGQAP